MDKEKYINDLKEIKDTMSRATRFISLSGLSGVSTGITAFVGAFIAYLAVFKGNDYLKYQAIKIEDRELWYLILISVGTFALSVGNAVFFTSRITRKLNQKPWNTQSKRLIVQLAIPLTTGGVLCLMFLLKGFVGLLPSLTLVFYGLALINSSKFTVSEIKNLGIIEIFLGLLSFQFITYSLIFWVIGFGLFQMIYGLIVQKKYKM